MESANAIELKKISKYFGEVIANKNISLEVRKGEILSLLGENGSGKTTLMNMLAGIYFPDEGEIIIDGKEVKITCPADAFQLGIGMIHQHFKLIETFTAAENIILGLPGKEIIKMNEVVEKINGLVNKYGFELDPNKKIIAQINKNIPRVYGSSHDYHVNDIAAFVECHKDELMPSSQPPTATEEKIASYILERIPDGACIQLGIGGTANAVGFGLKDKKHLGIHSEMYTDSMAYHRRC